jgi:hypothetical protein
MKFWRSKLFAILAPWRDECFEESNVEINWHIGKRKTSRWRPAGASIANCAVTSSNFKAQRQAAQYLRSESLLSTLLNDLNDLEHLNCFVE